MMLKLDESIFSRLRMNLAKVKKLVLLDYVLLSICFWKFQSKHSFVGVNLIFSGPQNFDRCVDLSINKTINYIIFKTLLFIELKYSRAFSHFSRTSLKVLLLFSKST